MVVGGVNVVEKMEAPLSLYQNGGSKKGFRREKKKGTELHWIAVLKQSA